MTYKVSALIQEWQESAGTTPTRVGASGWEQTGVRLAQGADGPIVSDQGIKLSPAGVCLGC